MFFNIPSKTEAVLTPLQTLLAEVETQIEEKLEQIHAVKSVVSENDLRMDRMIREACSGLLC